MSSGSPADINLTPMDLLPSSGLTRNTATHTNIHIHTHTHKHTLTDMCMHTQRHTNTNKENNCFLKEFSILA